MSEKERAFDLNTLTHQQLGGLKEQLEGELENLFHSLRTFQDVLKQYNLSELALSSLKDQEPGRQILLPLTSSLYVSGELQDPRHVLVDIGTGYFVEKDCLEGIDFCKRKATMLKSNSEELMKLVREKQEAIAQVQRVLRSKASTGTAGG
uniref:Prefoldin alpha subunit n=1 Tax=Tetraselmis sp. GSL018 TaxID=582737 RepID=A0A061R393_9CHLO